MSRPRSDHSMARQLRERARYLAVLDTMWGGGPGRSPRWFPINPDNHSGKRLYLITECRYLELWVTNVCPQRVQSATEHGTPDLTWLSDNLSMAPPELPLLVCGGRAQRAFDALALRPPNKVVRLPHPAARHWGSSEVLSAVQMVRAAKA